MDGITELCGTNEIVHPRVGFVGAHAQRQAPQPDVAIPRGLPHQRRPHTHQLGFVGDEDLTGRDRKHAGDRTEQRGFAGTIEADAFRVLEKSLRIGLFGIGLDSYWPQFKGLEARLNGYLNRVAAKLKPKKWGERIQVAGDADSPVKVEAEVQADKLLQAILANAQMTRQADGE